MSYREAFSYITGFFGVTNLLTAAEYESVPIIRNTLTVTAGLSLIAAMLLYPKQDENTIKYTQEENIQKRSKYITNEELIDKF